MAEHDSGREDREGQEGREPEEKGVPFDEDAAWEARVRRGRGEPPRPPPPQPENRGGGQAPRGNGTQHTRG
ncbi:hypothetical protein ACFW8Z_03985, partial [Streptomyces sp. NPDC059515]